jgi:hypothetical protein
LRIGDAEHAHMAFFGQQVGHPFLVDLHVLPAAAMSYVGPTEKAISPLITRVW